MNRLAGLAGDLDLNEAMDTNYDISDEAFAAKEKEIAHLFASEISDNEGGSGDDPESDFSSESRVDRILARARQEPTQTGQVRIGRIISRLKEEADSRT